MRQSGAVDPPRAIQQLSWRGAILASTTDTFVFVADQCDAIIHHNLNSLAL